MKFLAALTFLLPAVHVAASIEYFGLRTGTQPGARVVVKSPEDPNYYVVVDSGSGVVPERFRWGPERIIIDLNGKAVLVDRRDDDYLHAAPIEKGTEGFDFDCEGALVKNDDQGEMWFLCPVEGDANKKKLRFSIYYDFDCEEINLYKIPLSAVYA